MFNNKNYLETLPLEQTHLFGWWDGHNGLVYCAIRKVLMSVDLPTIIGLLGQPANDVNLKNNLHLLNDVTQPLPQPNTPAGFASELTLHTSKVHQECMDVFAFTKRMVTKNLTIHLCIQHDQALFENLCLLFKNIETHHSSYTNHLTQYHLDIVLKDTPQGWILQANQDFEVTGLKTEQLAPMLMDIIMTGYYRSLPFEFAFHGAAIQWQGKNMFFAAASGKGKSTLTAFFANQGATILSDEVICLDTDFEPSQIRLPMTLKSGSWPFAGSLDEQMSIWNRGDGRRLKYFVPKWREPQLNLPTALFFPSFDLDSDEKMQQTGPCKALQILALSGYEFAENSADAINKLLIWLDSIPTFEVSYHDRSHALLMIKDFFDE